MYMGDNAHHVDGSAALLDEVADDNHILLHQSGCPTLQTFCTAAWLLPQNWPVDRHHELLYQCNVLTTETESGVQQTT